MSSPLHQFEVKKIVDLSVAGIDISFTNSALYMVVATVLVCLFFHFGTKGKKLIPTKEQSACELLFHFVNNVLVDQVGKEGIKYFPYIFTVCMFVLSTNIIGLIPYSFTPTSQIVVTFVLSMLVFIGITFVGIMRNKMHFFRHFCPPSIPILVMPILVPVEIISYLLKPISLSIRLCANMTAGHIILKMISGGAVSCVVLFHDILKCTFIFPTLINIVMLAFELFVAILQAYIFTILSCIYLNDVMHME
ncbi:MAG: F0F1 ATP synthase subunit A [Holosporales bacterium]|jgi:F-type H+-transporting ATPase subunit a|nr:F0F1 ATP synthase subunit A [Holosporales bacterium]